MKVNRTVVLGILVALCMSQAQSQPAGRAKSAVGFERLSTDFRPEKQLTHGPKNRVLTNTGVWSPDGDWIVYDTRKVDFDGDTIEMVNVNTGEIRELYRSKNGAHCGVVTFHPRENKVIFILGPENPSADWQYCTYHRQGVIINATETPSAEVVNLDARDVSPPFTPGALRGGSHVHVWDATGDWVSFTYEDHVLAQMKDTASGHDVNLRNIGVSAPIRSVHVSKKHPRNHDGAYFTVLAARTTANPKPGSDEIKKAYEEGWVGTNGYVRADGRAQRRALAFQGDVVTHDGQVIAEVFIVDLSEDLTRPGDGPLAGTQTRTPFPPQGWSQRRLTFTTQRKFPGVQGPRHWLRSSPDGSRIAFLMKDDAGTVQLWTVPPAGGSALQITHNPFPISSTFTWSPDGRQIAHVMDNSICVTEIPSGKTQRLTPRSEGNFAPRSEACVFSPNGKKLAYLRRIDEAGGVTDQIFVLSL